MKHHAIIIWYDPFTKDGIVKLENGSKERITSETIIWTNDMRPSTKCIVEIREHTQFGSIVNLIQEGFTC